MRSRFMLTAALLVLTAPSNVVGQSSVKSPDGRNEVQVAIHEGGLYYMVQRDGKTLLTPSRLGFVFRGQPPLRDSLRIADSSRSTFDETWTQPWGEVRRVRNHSTAASTRAGADSMRSAAPSAASLGGRSNRR